jgi:hypothetical protein
MKMGCWTSAPGLDRLFAREERNVTGWPQADQTRCERGFRPRSKQEPDLSGRGGYPGVSLVTSSGSLDLVRENVSPRFVTDAGLIETFQQRRPISLRETKLNELPDRTISAVGGHRQHGSHYLPDKLIRMIVEPLEKLVWQWLWQSGA